MKTLLITGGSSDIASAFIQKYAANFDKIICQYRTKLGMESVVPFQCDFSEDNAAIELCQELEKMQLIPTHFLHLPALPNENKHFNKTSWDECQSHLNVSAKSFYEISKFLLPHMAKNKYGKIVALLTGNVVANPPESYSLPYTAAKCYLLSLVKCLASEYSNKNININAVSPSYFESKFNQNLPDLVKELNASKYPGNKAMTPDDIIPTINLLLSDESGFISGQNIPITGGR